MKKIIGIDVGGTKIRGVLVDLNGKILEEKEIVTYKNHKKDLDSLIGLIERFNSKAVIGIGVGVPGSLDLKRESIIGFSNLPGWENFKLKDFLKNKFKKRVEIENDVNCVALAEKKFGAGIKYKNFIVINIGTGLGGGIIIDNKLYEVRGNAGEFGQGKFFGHGKNKSFEDLVSTKALLMIARRNGLSGDSFKILEEAKNGNKKAKKVYEEVGKSLGEGISNLVFYFDPEIVLIGGGLMNAGEFLLGPARKNAGLQFGRNVKIKQVGLLKNGGAIGAASLL